MNVEEVKNYLKENLNTYSGVIQENVIDDSDNYWKKVFDVRWHRNVHFVLYCDSTGRPGFYHVERDNKGISEFHWVRKFREEVMVSMQHLINDIEAGRYNRKKTLSESIRCEVENRGLTGYMNTTKWKELIGELEKHRNLSFMYKSLFDADTPKYYWTVKGDEEIAYMDYAVIEWMKINPQITEVEYIGRLIEPNLIKTDLSLEVESILNRYSIFYEYDEAEGIYTVFGWK